MPRNLILLNSFVPRWAISFHLTPRERGAGLETGAGTARNPRKSALVWFLWHCPFEAAVRKVLVETGGEKHSGDVDVVCFFSTILPNLCD